MLTRWSRFSDCYDRALHHPGLSRRLRPRRLAHRLARETLETTAAPAIPADVQGEAGGGEVMTELTQAERDLLAEKVMGWHLTTDEEPYPFHSDNVWRDSDERWMCWHKEWTPDKEISQAFMLVEALIADGWEFYVMAEKQFPGVRNAAFYDDERAYEGYASTFALAISIAALRLAEDRCD